jgi:hypothetical protein
MGGRTGAGSAPLLRFTGSLFPLAPCVCCAIIAGLASASRRGNPVRIQPIQSLLAFCEYSLDHAALFWGPAASAQMMEALLPAWPPEVDVKGLPTRWKHSMSSARAWGSLMPWPANGRRPYAC